MSLFNCAKTRVGLTLLELVIALGILAVMSTVAIRSLEPLADQSRYEVSRKLLEDVRSATITGPGAALVGGQPMVSGFLVDTGMLPASGDDLISKPGSLASYASQSFDSDRDTVNDITISSGWNGPYLHLQAGNSSIEDGWGNDIQVDPDGGVFDFLSYGADGDSVVPETGYDDDISVAINANEYTVDITFRIFDIDGTTGTRIDPSPTGTEQLGILFYTPNANGGTDGSVEEKTLIVASAGSFEVVNSATVTGAVAARAFLWDDTDSDDVFEVGEAVTSKSYVHYFYAVPGSGMRVEMELR